MLVSILADSSSCRRCISLFRHSDFLYCNVESKNQEDPILKFYLGDFCGLNVKRPQKLCLHTCSPVGSHVLKATAPLKARDFEGSGMLVTNL